MSNEDLDKLADLIVNKLVEKQQQIDEEYMQRMLDEQAAMKDSEDYTVSHFYTLSSSDKSHEEVHEEFKRDRKIEELEEALKEAIAKEDYMRAADIQSNITRLKDQGN
jgi:hypothetical protein